MNSIVVRQTVVVSILVAPQQLHRGTSLTDRDYAYRSSLPGCLTW